MPQVPWLWRTTVRASTLGETSLGLSSALHLAQVNATSVGRHYDDVIYAVLHDDNVLRDPNDEVAGDLYDDQIDVGRRGQKEWEHAEQSWAVALPVVS